MAGRKNNRNHGNAVQLRRQYVDSRHGQLHLVTAYPQSGGFDERTALLLLHGDGGSGLEFRAVAARLGTDRSVYAPDLPGSGNSDGPARPTVADQAAALADLLDALRLKEVDAVGTGRGVLVALELAALRPRQLRRLAIAGQPPAGGTSRPMLQLAADPARSTDAAAAAIVAEIRGFFDR